MTSARSVGVTGASGACANTVGVTGASDACANTVGELGLVVLVLILLV